MSTTGDQPPTAHDISEAERLVRARHYAHVLRKRPDLVQVAATRIARVAETGEATRG